MSIDRPNQDSVPAVHIDSVSKQFVGGDLAVRDVTLTIHSGTFTVLLGTSGAGKSTLLRMINGLETPTGGTILVHGTEINARTAMGLRREIGMIFQQFNLVGRLSVLTNVLVGRLGHLRGFRRFLSYLYLFHAEDRLIARRALDRVGLTAKAFDRADRLSGGQQQRVGIARAMAQQPRLLLADEPVASLDPVIADEVMTLLQEIVRENGLTAIVTLHQVELARRFADRIIALKKGQLVFDGPPSALTDTVLAQIYQTVPDASGVAAAQSAPRGVPAAGVLPA